MPRSAKVNEESTKSEILDVYRELLVEEGSVLASASKETVEKIIKDLTQLKLSVTSTLPLKRCGI